MDTPRSLSVRTPHRSVWHPVLLIVVAALTPALPAGPLALAASVWLVVSTTHRLVARVTPADTLARWAFTLLSALLYLAGIAELLSLLQVMNEPAWWLAIQAAGYALTRLVPPTPIRSDVNDGWRRLIRRLPPLGHAALVVFLLLAGANLLLAGLAGITEYDSMTTYVPVVIDFCQQGHLGYPPHPRPGETEAWVAPVSFLTNWHKVYAYTIVITDSIVLLNILGWLATAGAFVATLAICQTLRVPRYVGLLANLIIFAAPQFIAQSANTMYDQVQAFTMAGVVLAFLKCLRRPTLGWAVLFALAHVAVMAMKLTWAFVAPILLILDFFLVYWLLRHRRPAALLSLVSVGVLGVAALVLPHFLRNLDYYGNWTPRGSSVNKVVREPSMQLTRVFLLRNLKCLLPFELHYVTAKPPLPHVLDYPFRKALWTHIATPYTEAAAYFGIQPLALAALLIAATVTPRVWRRRRRWLLFTWLCLLAWLIFQGAYALLFGFTPWNGRYMLIMWFLAAPALATTLVCLRPGTRRIVLSVLVVWVSAEAVAFFLQREHMPIRDVLNRSRLDHFHRDPRYPRSNIPRARAFLDTRDAYDVQTDVPGFLRLQYFDALRQRRIRYVPEIDFAGRGAYITDLNTAERAVPGFDICYETFRVTGDVHLRGPRTVVVARGVLEPAPPALVRVADDHTTPLDVLGIAVGDALGGELERAGDGALAWLGPGPPGSLRLDLAAERATTVWIGLRVRKTGPAFPDGPTPLHVYRGLEHVDTCPLIGPGGYLLRVPLEPGPNALRFVIAAADTGQRYYRDDRPTAALVDRLLVLPADGPLPADYLRPPYTTDAAGRLFGTDAALGTTARLLDADWPAAWGAIESDAAGREHLWLGPADSGALQLIAAARQPTTCSLTFDVRQLGVALPDNQRCPIELIVADRLLVTTTLADIGQYTCALALPEGLTAIRLRIPTSPDAERYGRDQRPSLLYISNMRLRPAPPAVPSTAVELSASPPVFFTPSDESTTRITHPPGAFVTIAPALQASITADALLVRPLMGPPTDDDPPVVWLGPHAAGELTLRLHMQAYQPALLRLDVRRFGRALACPDHTVLQVLLDGRPAGWLEISAPGPHDIPLMLPAGAHDLTLRIPHDPDGERYGLDPRPALLLLGPLALQELPATLAPPPGRRLITLDNRAAGLQLLDARPGPLLGGFECTSEDVAVWLGPRAAGALTLQLRATEPGPVTLTFDVLQQGIAAPDACPLAVHLDDQPIQRFEDTTTGRYSATVALPAGTHTLSLMIPADATAARYHGDPRPTMLLIGNIRIATDTATP